MENMDNADVASCELGAVGLRTREPRISKVIMQHIVVIVHTPPCQLI